MKTTFIFAIATVATMCFAGCGSSEGSPAEDEGTPTLEEQSTTEDPGVVGFDEGDSDGEDDSFLADTTGAKCGPNLKACPSGQICNITSCAAGATGVCVTKPAPNKCPLTWAPVCGCDGKSYGNDCVRIRAGAKKKANGSCQNIHCKADGTCPASMTCDWRHETNKALDWCVVAPKACPTPNATVCGADVFCDPGKGYLNYGTDCDRIYSGALFRHNGACTNAELKKSETCVPD